MGSLRAGGAPGGVVGVGVAMPVDAPGSVDAFDNDKLDVEVEVEVEVVGVDGFVVVVAVVVPVVEAGVKVASDVCMGAFATWDWNTILAPPCRAAPSPRDSRAPSRRAYRMA